ncbi:MAG: site-2 protease family protein [Candidatus Koribacter versatilis]|uniref:Site-2 protease family protein n=1 Tax=Candidatus Korobacter versatilis TaxID=658062 RepID=A0A932EQF0_9BACT|nr:site-2 protease family protein [Candidatus Koribacter versatilis]
MSSPEPTLPAEYDPHLHQVYIITPTRRRYWLHVLLFLATVFTTLVMGARLQFNFINNLPPLRPSEDFFPVAWALRNGHLLLGIPFSVTLLAILLAHELGHFLYCLRYRVYATLPFFIPFPSLIGTFGAFIRIKSPIPTRRALFDIAVAGPIAGFVLAVPAAIAGLVLSRHSAVLVSDGDSMQFGYPLIFYVLHALLPWPATGAMTLSISDLYLHPIALAAWVGMLATGLNLLPGGQLDGGHIVYAVAPQAHRAVTRALILLLIPMGIFFWGGWLMWSFFLLLMGRWARHPQVSLYPPLDTKRRVLAAFALLMLVLTLIPAPFAGGSALEAWEQYTHQR